MILEKINNNEVIFKNELSRINSYEDNLKMIRSDLSYDNIRFSFKCDKDFERLKLLVILSPIFIAIFDSSHERMANYKAYLEKSNFTYGIYPNFFSFDLKSYFDFYKSHKKFEDIMLDESLNINFSINALDDSYILALFFFLDELICNKENRKYYLDYFREIRDDIVINGRRSILANGDRAFYLSKYVLVRMLDIIADLYEKSDQSKLYLNPISNSINNLKRPIY